MAAITSSAVKKFLRNNEVYSGFTIACIVVYPEIENAKAVLFSRNHVFYEVWIRPTYSGRLEVGEENLMIPYDREMFQR